MFPEMRIATFDEDLIVASLKKFFAVSSEIELYPDAETSHDFVTNENQSVIYLSEASGASPEVKKNDSKDPKSRYHKVIPGWRRAPADGAAKMANYTRTLNKDNKLEENEKAFLNMIKYCVSNGYKFALLRSPTTHEFWNSRISDWDEELERLREKVKTIIPESQFEIWDDERTGEFPINLFNDPNHLNGEGYGKYSRKINNRIKAILAVDKKEQ